MRGDQAAPGCLDLSMPKDSGPYANPTLSVPAAARSLARAVLVHGPISRAELAARLGLSVPSLSRLGAPLLRQGLLVEEVPAGAGAIGRPVRLLDVRADAGRFLGIKITADEIYAVCTDLRARPLALVQRKLGSREVSDVVDRIVGVVAGLSEGPVRLTGVGISLGGKVSAEGLVLRAPYLGWRDVPLADLVQARIGIPVVLENDGQALAVAQQWFGAGRMADDFAVLTIGAGVGHGLVLNDRLIESEDWGLGLLAHFPIDAAGPQCAAGHRGCASAFLTIDGICRRLTEVLGEPTGYADGLRLAAAGHPQVRELMAQAGRALGVLVAAVVNFTGVATVVLAGEGMGLFSIAEPAVRAGLAEHRDVDARAVELIPLSEDFAEWALGAAAVAIERRLVGRWLR